MGVMLQAFYWDCPRRKTANTNGGPLSNRNCRRSRKPVSARCGFRLQTRQPAGNRWATILTITTISASLIRKAACRRGSVPRPTCSTSSSLRTRWDCKSTADLVFNHNSGADSQEPNPIDGQSRWTKFTPKSGKFPRDWKCFHPKSYETWDGVLRRHAGSLSSHTVCLYRAHQLCALAVEEIGFDGFRYDMVKGYGGWMVRSIQELRALRGGTSFKPYAVGECWDSERTIDDWLDEANAWSDNPVGAFDFPLRWRLRDLCDSYGFSLRTLAERGVLMWGRPETGRHFRREPRRGARHSDH